jgi:hypothetical protein
MRIKQISVSGLFGIFDHVIPLNMDERITVIHGPNGFGKTAMLRILNGFFNSQYSELQTIPFSKFCIEFDDGSNVEIIKNVNNLDEIEKNFVVNFHNPNAKIVDINLIYPPNREDFSLGNIGKFIPGLEQITSEKWLYTPTKEIFGLGEVLSRFSDSLGITFQATDKEEPESFEKFKNNVDIRLIESQRLLNLFPNHRFTSVEILSVGLRKAIGTNKTVVVEANSLERNLRLAYEVAYFYKTQLYLEIRKWETNNQPFHVLQIIE